MFGNMFGPESESESDDPSSYDWEPETICAFGRSLRILEGYANTKGEAGEDGFDESLKSWHGDLVWPATKLLVSSFEAAYPIVDGRPSLAGIRVLELGSGTGALGLCLAAGGAHVTMSDLPDNTKLIRENIKRNSAAGTLSGRGSADTVVLHWQNLDSFAKALSGRSFDLILVSDCIYDRGVSLTLFAALRRAAEVTSPSDSEKHARIVLCNKGRWYRGVLADMREHFELRTLSPSNILMRVEMSSSMDESHSSSWESAAISDSSIFAFELSLRRDTANTAKLAVFAESGDAASNNSSTIDNATATEGVEHTQQILRQFAQKIAALEMEISAYKAESRAMISGQKKQINSLSSQVRNLTAQVNCLNAEKQSAESDSGGGSGWTFSSSLSQDKLTQISSLLALNGLSQQSGGPAAAPIPESAAAERRRKGDAAFARMVALYPSAKTIVRN